MAKCFICGEHATRTSKNGTSGCYCEQCYDIHHLNPYERNNRATTFKNRNQSKGDFLGFFSGRKERF
jgi:hypothetical protein